MAAVASIPGILRARATGRLTPAGARDAFAMASPACKGELERLDPALFLSHLRERVGEGEYKKLTGRVIFDGERLSEGVLVRRLIARIYRQLQVLVGFAQTDEWRATVSSFIALESPPESSSVDDFMIRESWCNPPFAQLTWPEYAQHPAAAGTSIYYLIVGMYRTVTGYVKAIRDED